MSWRRLLRRMADGDGDLVRARQRYLASLLRAARVLPGDSTLRKLIDDAREADHIMRPR